MQAQPLDQHLNSTSCCLLDIVGLELLLFTAAARLRFLCSSLICVSGGMKVEHHLITFVLLDSQSVEALMGRKSETADLCAASVIRAGKNILLITFPAQ